MPDFPTLLNRLRRPSYWATALTLAIAFFLASYVWQGRMAERAKRTAQTVADLEARLLAAKPEAAVPHVPEPDFVSKLPPTAPVEPIVRDLQRASAALKVVFVAMDANSKNATARTLGRTELTVTLRGDYSRLKAVLAEVLDRYPNLVLKQLSVRQVLAPTDLEASVKLLLLSRPMPAGGSN